MEHQESLQSCTLIGQFSDSVKNSIDQLFSHGVVATGIVVGSIFLTGDKLLRMEQLSVCASSDLINDSGLQINKQGPGYVFSRSSLREEGVERVVSPTNSLVRRHLTVRLDTVLETVQLPASITHLCTGLADMDADALAHFDWKMM